MCHCVDTEENCIVPSVFSGSGRSGTELVTLDAKRHTASEHIQNTPVLRRSGWARDFRLFQRPRERADVRTRIRRSKYKVTASA